MGKCIRVNERAENERRERERVAERKKPNNVHGIECLEPVKKMMPWPSRSLTYRRYIYILLLSGSDTLCHS